MKTLQDRFLKCVLQKSPSLKVVYIFIFKLHLYKTPSRLMLCVSVFCSIFWHVWTQTAMLRLLNLACFWGLFWKKNNTQWRFIFKRPCTRRAVTATTPGVCTAFYYMSKIIKKFGESIILLRSQQKFFTRILHLTCLFCQRFHFLPCHVKRSEMVFSFD